MSNKIIKDKPVKKKQNKFIKHMLSTKGCEKGIPNWFLYLVLVMFIYGIVSNIPW